MAHQKYQDLGFAGKAAEAKARLLNRDGTFNIRRKGLPFFSSFSFYHTLIAMSWWKFNAIVLLCFVAVNALFALAYLFVGIDGFAGVTNGVIAGHRTISNFVESFFFSTQTFTTVGYGRISPVGFLANAIAALESMTGLLAFALATGLLYGRFSRPYAKLLFSERAVVAPYRDGTGFMFRIANQRTNQLIEVEAKLVVVKFESVLTPLGERRRERRFYELDLERDKLNFFHLSWTIVHPIEASSPLYGMSQQDLDESEAEFLILIKAFDDAFSQTVHARSSYKHHEVHYENKFSQILETAPDGVTEIHLDRISAIERV